MPKLDELIHSKSPQPHFHGNIFHFILTELHRQIRREYQKFVENSWLPQCFQCAVTTTEDQGPTASPANNALSANVLLPASNTSTKKKNGPVDAVDVTGQFLTMSPAHHPQGQTSTLMRHHQMQRQHAMPPYSGTLREHRSGTMSPAGSSKYAGAGHKYQYDFQNPELIYPHAAAAAANSQQFHQLHHGMSSRLSYYQFVIIFKINIFQTNRFFQMITQK